MAGIKQFTQEVHGVDELQTELKKMNEDREQRDISQRKTDKRNYLIGMSGIIIAVLSLAVAIIALFNT